MKPLTAKKIIAGITSGEFIVEREMPLDRHLWFSFDITTRRKELVLSFSRYFDYLLDRDFCPSRYYDFYKTDDGRIVQNAEYDNSNLINEYGEISISEEEEAKAIRLIRKHNYFYIDFKTFFEEYELYHFKEYYEEED